MASDVIARRSNLQHLLFHLFTVRATGCSHATLTLHSKDYMGSVWRVWRRSRRASPLHFQKEVKENGSVNMLGSTDDFGMYNFWIVFRTQKSKRQP